MPLNNFGIVSVSPRLVRLAQPDINGLADLYTFGIRYLISLNGALDEGFAGRVEPHALDTLLVTKAELIEISGRIDFFLALGATGVHCTHGVDRTGAAIAAWKMLRLGWTRDDTQAERELYGITPLRNAADLAIGRALDEIWADLRGGKG